ncbi:nicotinate phosphoribosyltransferase [Linnemannia elongata AG-77]|uniref:Nicotinate phosphoribosyltransferase n=1 Tax=Linnemannia elongata AG-77 TaxID=1314771 RepID=A0A197JRH1_9FUNG|nr:nicotinate phosphoribosyltransferase [Linnemannia elongata AG-77]
MSSSTTTGASTTDGQLPPSMACTSILDNDLYKFTMQQAVLQHYPNTPCSYHFTNRSPLRARLPRTALPWLREKIDSMATVRLTPEERVFLERRCPYLKPAYLDWLESTFRFCPQEEVKVEWKTGGGSLVVQSEPGSPRLDASGDLQEVPLTNNTAGLNTRVSQLQQEQQTTTTTTSNKEDIVEITIQGDWAQVILYEVPILALVSEAYFRFGDQDWSYSGQFESARSKSERLVAAGASFAEFGTRRRRDYETQRIVIQGLIAGSASDKKGDNGESVAMTAAEAMAAGKGFLTGTSNLHFAHLMDIPPIGTMAHEWFMGTAAILSDASLANAEALNRWAQTYPHQVLGIALTDTFTTAAFLKTFRGSLARDWIGVRHDSGDAFEFMDRMIQHYDQDPLVGPEMRRKKKIVFSDGLDTDLAIRLYEAAVQKGIGATFGIGTHFTNDYHHLSGTEGEKSPAMNIVIKLHSCAGRECVKLSDDHGKESGSPEAVAQVKQQIATLV